jgi:hypothetical protein
MLSLDVKIEELEVTVPTLALTRQQVASHLTILQNMWNDRFRATVDPEVLGFTEDTKVDGGLIGQAFKAFVKELHLLLCTSDRKYAKLRQELSRIKGRHATVVVSAIAAGLAASLGIAAGLLVPFVAVIAHAVATLGANTACRMLEEPR